MTMHPLSGPYDTRLPDEQAMLERAKAELARGGIECEERRTTQGVELWRTVKGLNRSEWQRRNYSKPD